MNKKNIRYLIGLVVGFLVIILGTKYGLNFFDEVPISNIEENSQNLVNIEEDESNLKLHFIDVGQADSILIQQSGKFMLIDAGNNDDGEGIVNYLNKIGVKKLDYVIGTHAHEDHIGGMDDVINNFDVDRILFPKSSNNTKTFEDFVKAVKEKNKKLYSPKSGENFQFADSIFQVIAPNSDKYEDTNNYSIVMKLTYKDSSFLFTGDAEALSENEILQKGYDIKSDLLKIGHHGSSSSTSDKFLRAVNPKYAVICVGKDNSYNHPKKSVMDRLKRYSIDVYRTDEQGTIVVNCDGKGISFDKSPASYNYMK